MMCRSACILLFAALVTTAVSAVYYPRLAVTKPAATDIVLTGDKLRIEWHNITPEHVEFPPTTHIRLRSLDNASFVFDIANNVKTDLFHYEWTVPRSIQNNDAYYVRLLPQRGEWMHDGKRLPDIVSSNSRPFIIVGGQGDLKQMSFLQPSAGHVWNGGEVRYIEWTFEDATVDAIVSILLENDRRLDEPYVVVSQMPALPNDDNVVGVQWHVPTSLPNSSTYRLRIVAQYTGEGNRPPISSIGPKFTIAQQKA